MVDLDIFGSLKVIFEHWFILKQLRLQRQKSFNKSEMNIKRKMKNDSCQINFYY